MGSNMQWSDRGGRVAWGPFRSRLWNKTERQKYVATLRFVGRTTDGSRYIVKDEEGEEMRLTAVGLVHIFGSSREVGEWLAHGSEQQQESSGG